MIWRMDLLGMLARERCILGFSLAASTGRLLRRAAVLIITGQVIPA